MSNLSAIQKEFQTQLLKQKSDLASLIIESNKLSSKERIQIYTNGYNARLIDVLANNYPKLHQYLGNDKFYQLAKNYLAQYPSHFRSIRWFGDKLSACLQVQHPYCKSPILAELAQFEWAIETTFDAADKTIARAEEFKKIPPERWRKLTFTFHPSLQLLEFKYNTVSVWESLLANNHKRATRLKTPNQIVFWRHELETFYRVLSPMETCILKHAIEGNSFAKLCEQMAKWIPDYKIANMAANLLLSWLTAGFIINCPSN